MEVVLVVQILPISDFRLSTSEPSLGSPKSSGETDVKVKLNTDENLHVWLTQEFTLLFYRLAQAPLRSHPEARRR